MPPTKEDVFEKIKEALIDALGVDDDRAALLQAVNVPAPTRQASHVLPAMVARGGGTVVAIASVAAITHTPYMAHYNASKAALSAWTETVRVELRGTGVNVLTVYPGPVATPMEVRAREVIPANALADRVPTGTADELAAKIQQAIRRGRARLVYPAIYGLTRYARASSQWVVNRFTPKVPGRS